MFSRKFDDVVICGCLHSAEFMSFHWLGTEVGVRCVRDYFDLENDFYLRQAYMIIVFLNSETALTTLVDVSSALASTWVDLIE